MRLEGLEVSGRKKVIGGEKELWGAGSTGESPAGARLGGYTTSTIIFSLHILLLLLSLSYLLVVIQLVLRRIAACSLES